MGCGLTHLALEDREKARPVIAAHIAYGLKAFKGLWPRRRTGEQIPAGVRLADRR
jgi:hypothetical protein